MNLLEQNDTFVYVPLLQIWGKCLVFANYRYEMLNILPLHIINDSYDIAQTINQSVCTELCLLALQLKLICL